MQRTTATSSSECRAINLISTLQNQFAERLAHLTAELGQSGEFYPVEWFRDQGRHGGGVRLVAPDDSIFNRGAVNFSHVHYSDQPEKSLSSATALSTIIHPRHPLAPSVHIHISWTQMKNGQGYWRIMADLNPAIPNPDHTRIFEEILQEAAGPLYQTGKEQGERYFYIPALKRHRGVAHFYLENFHTDDPDADAKLAETFGDHVTRGYTDILRQALAATREPTVDELNAQLEYHTVYFFQVLTLDRGTTSGLLVHNQNDVGTLGSLPAKVDKNLLRSWQNKVPEPQNELVASLINALKCDDVCPIDQETKTRLAQVVRQHYQEHPQALELQARGDVIPPTVANHK